ncbi:hypothetical protein [Streptomyces sp. SLBN-115]|uniref:hypothetical protein n=1 Tax=Streptomyces sp. SLBN-115 TaxID=2768453 RepID=UPI001152F770|nr:hypothetical protein [Streptomyces sp. SLBN-115]
MRHEEGTQGRHRTDTGRRSVSEATVTPAGDGLPRRLPSAAGQRAGRTNGECPAVGDRTVVDGSKVIPHARSRKAGKALTGRQPPEAPH